MAQKWATVTPFYSIMNLVVSWCYIVIFLTFVRFTSSFTFNTLKDWLLELKQKQVNIFNVYLLYWLQLLVSDDRDTVLKCDHMK